MYLLDTDTLSNLMRRAPPAALIARIASTPRDQQFTSSITLGELVYGAQRLLAGPAATLRQRQESLLRHMPILPFDAAAARRYGQVRANLERGGVVTGDADLRIASIALTRNLIVVTGNVRHFGRVPGLQVENWLV
jgi:tRNA(fMet)-specific endonuclease VapC